MLELSMVIEAEADPATLPLGPQFAMVRHVPSPDPDRPALRQLLWVELEDFAVQECWRGRGHARMVNPLSSRLDRIAPTAVVGAWYGKFSWCLPWAKILWEDQL